MDARPSRGTRPLAGCVSGAEVGAMSVPPFCVRGGAATGAPGLRVDLPAVHRELDRRVAGLELLPEPVQPGGAEPADAGGLGEVEDVAEDGRLRAGDVR